MMSIPTYILSPPKSKFSSARDLELSVRDYRSESIVRFLNLKVIVQGFNHDTIGMARFGDNPMLTFNLRSEKIKWR